MAEKLKRGRPKGVKNGERKPIDLKLVAALCKADCTQYEIATALDYSEAGFSRRVNSDPELKKILELNYVAGKISLRREQARNAMDRYFTICKDCGKITEHAGEFLPRCAYCDSENVRHQFIPGSTGMLIWLGKQKLHQSDRVMVQGDAEKPLEVNNNVSIRSLPDKDIRQLQAIARRASVKPRNGKKASA